MILVLVLLFGPFPDAMIAVGCLHDGIMVCQAVAFHALLASSLSKYPIFMLLCVF